jgi:TRAP-type C4-dicarboxylate transport system substrate-binding protein
MRYETINKKGDSKMKKTATNFSKIFIGALMLIASSLASAQTELSMSTVYMNTHPTVVNAWEPWFKEVAAKTGGKLKLTYFNPNTLASLPDTFDATVSGMIGLGGMDHARNPGKFPIFTVMELPGVARSAESGSLVISELYNKYPEFQKELKDIKTLWVWVSAPFQLHTTKKQVKTLSDLKGMQIIAWNKTSVNILKALGANAIMMPPTDSYLALERGMADGILCPLAPVISYKISEAVRYTTVSDIFVTPFWAGFGHPVWNSLPKNFQAVLQDTTGASMALMSGKTLDAGDVNDSARLKTNGHTFYVLPTEERDRWFAATNSLRENWVKEMESLGYKNARRIMEDAFNLGTKHTSIASH